AIKIMDLEHVNINISDIRLEVQTMRLSLHPNVLVCHTSFIHDTHLWLVTQLMSKGSSLHCLQSAQSLLFEAHITYILYETLLGLKYIHDNGQIHRDIKAGNLLLDGDANVRIADFGVSSWLIDSGNRREHTTTFVGTPCWMAPEVLEQVDGYDYKADIWSLGITALELCKGYAPYAKYAPMKVLLLTIQEDPPTLETYNDGDDANMWSKSFRSMIKLCLQKDPSKRPTCQELLAHRHF
ncbi:protein kinase MAPKKKK, MAP4K-like protein, partial [Thalassiosira pseudonana CCMP1335]